ncbi:MAG: tetraacyldisaccharide 4'-kinase [Deltaproteobacteria bacterium]|nr:tetraacyldisaccharide 4'-kinase [Deltaproteobacteria bacterium]
MGLREKIEGLIHEQKISVGAHIALYPLSLLYGGISSLRANLYRNGVLKSYSLGCRVISVGNITVGGTGKTPVTIYLAEYLQRCGKRVVILSRGYKGTNKGTAVVTDGEKILLSPLEAGDEPYLMALRLKGVPVIVGADRVESGRFAIEKFSPDFIILDDGFQHIRLKRDFNIVLIDGAQGFGNQFLLPRGILREPLGGLMRADMLMVKGSNLQSSAREIVNKYKLPIVGFSYKPERLYERQGHQRPAAFLKGKKVCAFAGVANPESFFKSIESLGAKILERISFPDHHAYTEADFSKIKNLSADADMVLTTEKDIVKLKSLTDLPLYALAIDVDISDRGLFKNLLTPVIKGAR